MMGKWIEENRERIIETSRKIWEYAEPGLEEYQSSKELQKLLEENGFHVETGFSGMGTAFKAVWGSGAPVIGYLGEFDALPELSQKVGTQEEPLKEGSYGHGCGHNLLGTASAAAAIDLRYRLEAEKRPGTVVFWGCPDEEVGCGKSYLTRDGMFDELDVALTNHPGIANFVNEGIQSSVYTLDIEFWGRSSHAAAAPWDGRSALDAVELMLVGINYLREHVTKGISIHYIITDGGERPNMVPKHASARVMFRGETIQKTRDVYQRVLKIAEGAALMTETSFEHTINNAFYSFNVNETLAKAAYDSLCECGPVQWTQEELNFAAKLQGRYDEDTILESIRNYVTDAGIPYLRDVVLHEGVTPYLGKPFYTKGSTDVSDVSWVVPTVELCTACRPVGIAAHTWEQTSCAGMSIGQKGMLYAAQALSLTGYKLMTSPELLEQIKEEFAKSTEKGGYEPLLPAEKMPGR